MYIRMYVCVFVYSHTHTYIHTHTHTHTYLGFRPKAKLYTLSECEDISPVRSMPIGLGVCMRCIDAVRVYTYGIGGGFI